MLGYRVNNINSWVIFEGSYYHFISWHDALSCCCCCLTDNLVTTMIYCTQNTFFSFNLQRSLSFNWLMFFNDERSFVTVFRSHYLCWTEKLSLILLFTCSKKFPQNLPKISDNLGSSLAFCPLNWTLTGIIGFALCFSVSAIHVIRRKIGKMTCCLISDISG